MTPRVFVVDAEARHQRDEILEVVDLLPLERFARRGRKPTSGCPASDSARFCAVTMTSPSTGLSGWWRLLRGSPRSGQDHGDCAGNRQVRACGLLAHMQCSSRWSFGAQAQIGAQQPPEIAAQHGLDVRVAVAAADQCLGQVESLFWMVEAVRVELVAEGVARLVAGHQLLALVGRHVVIAVEVGVGADADVLDADELHDVVDVVDQVLDGGRLTVANEIPDAGDAHDAALGGELGDRLVGLEPRMIVQRAAVRVRDRDRPLGELDRVERRPVAAVRDIHQHADLVHRRDDRRAEVADAAVDAVRAAGADGGSGCCR